MNNFPILYVYNIRMLCGVLFLEKNLNYGKRFKGGEINEKDCFDGFIFGFGFGVGRVPASPRPSL